MGGTAFDLVQDRFWDCTGQRYGSTKEYRTSLAPGSDKEDCQYFPEGMRLSTFIRTQSRPARLSLIGLLVSASREGPPSVCWVHRLDTFAGESVA